MRLEQLLENFNKGGYCNVIPSKEVCNEIYEWITKTCKLEEVEESEEYHTTLIYDERNKDFKLTKPRTEYEAELTGVDLFGDENNVLVLLLKSDDLDERNKEITDAGYESRFPEYKPHITVKKISNEEELKILKKNLNKLKKKINPIILTNEKWEMIDETK